MKNLKGCLSGEEKLRFHKLGVSQAIVDLSTVVKPTFTIIDGIVGMEGAGPSNGKPIRMNLLLGSDDLLALEIIGAKVMGFNPYSIQHINLSKHKGIGEYDIRKIKVLGARVADVRKKFSFPLINLNKWIGSFFTGRAGILVSLISKSGVDVSKLAPRIINHFRPYPEFMDLCSGCAKCIINCPEKALRFQSPKIMGLNKEKCIKCYVCDEVCIYGNVRIKGKK
jgi:ferredoxin